MSADKSNRTPAEHAVMHILKRIKADPRLAYLIGAGSESFELLMVAGAAVTNHEVDPYREMFLVGLQTQPVPSAAGALVRAFREYLAVHPALTLDGQTMDDMALELAHAAYYGGAS